MQLSVQDFVQLAVQGFVQLIVQVSADRRRAALLAPLRPALRAAFRAA